jgi:acyl carrier protein
MQTIQSEIRAFVVENFLFGQDNNHLGNDESFLEGGIIDSTGVLELVAFLEERYQVRIDDDDLLPANLDSVNLLVHFVERKLQEKATLADVAEAAV